MGSAVQDRNIWSKNRSIARQRAPNTGCRRLKLWRVAVPQCREAIDSERKRPHQIGGADKVQFDATKGSVVVAFQSGTENITKRRARIRRSVLFDRFFLFGNFTRFD